MSISARNVFPGTVSAVVEGPIHAEVEITISGGDRLVASVTTASVAALGLKAGVSAVAVIKAPSVTLVAGESPWRFSARNQLKGTVAAVVGGAVNSQVKVALPGGAVLSAVVTNDAVADLALAAGVPVVAMFKAGQVVVGVPA